MPSIVRLPMPQGDAGTSLTVSKMRQMIHAGGKNPRIRELAASLAMHHATDQGKIGSVFDFVRNKMRYISDPRHQELVGSSEYHYRNLGQHGAMAGDCDDHTVMLGAMLESIGYPTRITTVRMRPGAGSYDHVYLEVHDRRQWIPLDASNKRRRPGEAPPHNRIRRW